MLIKMALKADCYFIAQAEMPTQQQLHLAGRSTDPCSSGSSKTKLMVLLHLFIG